MTEQMKAKVISSSLGSVFASGISASISSLASVFSSPNCVVFPGFCDVHVHFREPGFSYKETIASGCAAAARGGYTAVCTMPNLNPVPDTPQNLALQQELIDRSASIHVYPYGAITLDQQGQTLADLAGMAPHVAGFSDDGRGVQSTELMKTAMTQAKALGKIIVAHCEDNSLLHGGYIHDGQYARTHGHRGICSESEWGPIARDLELVAQTGCAYHVCHISTKESVDLIRKAKAQGLDVTCETGPHYLLMDDTMLQEDGRFKMNPPLRSPADREALVEGLLDGTIDTCETGPHYLLMDDTMLQEDGRFKMNPPLRSPADREALVEGLLDGTIDMIATDHAPHSAEEKSRGLEKSAFGVVGLETAFPVLYTYLVKPGILSLDRLVEVMAVNPRKRFGLSLDVDYSVWDLDSTYTVDPADFASQGKASPFTGWRVQGKCLATVCGGRLVYQAP